MTQYLLSIFQDLFADNWGIRSSEVLPHTLLTLAKFKKSALLMLPELLTNSDFRTKALKEIDDPLGTKPFWHYYNNLSLGEQIQLISPILNKLRQLFIHTSLKSLFGQSKSSFSLADLFFKRKVTLVSLNKGFIGTESAKFLGS